MLLNNNLLTPIGGSRSTTPVSGPASRSGTPGSTFEGGDDLMRFNRRHSNDIKNGDIVVNNYSGGGDNNFRNEKNSLVILPSSLHKNTLNGDTHFVSNGVNSLNIHKTKSGNDMTDSRIDNNNLKDIMIFKESFKQHAISSPAITLKNSSKPKSIRENR
jgi:hypothetical protein